VVIQTYQPDHYAIEAAKMQDYEGFYDRELAYRQMMCYPPVWNLLMIAVTSPKEEQAEDCAGALGLWLQQNTGVTVIGPTQAQVAKVNDIYRWVIYAKSEDYGELVFAKDGLEQVLSQGIWRQTGVQFDFNPMNGF
jgi:primosomal protein N' (replication factor Y)